ncbi:anhydro-N-acetylmuramic acid kinase [Isoptericola jiangsuensis]|uniref:Anhydro-N-acetylmuramic acid kinase n=1 Tax=Isoptericola jiangsuensis TaxID=548579 RepID=A0A2A9EY93_9MICO|nr:anhydro-N-acetylmuramic acid kinase [Isoptericola jiangsuensis]PFG43838.1 anhydro-N-acetylmuramic acid kinase [Isoptericola jiangsuensis]
MIVAGLMTGTSADALDVALVDLEPDATGAELSMRLLDHREVDLPPDLALDLLRLLEPRDVPLSLVSDVDGRLGRFCGEAVATVLAEAGTGCDLVVLHGQTVRHDVTDGVVTSTWQLGQPAWVAERTGVPVLSDVRARDVAAGGQGAPLAGLLDHLLLAGAAEPVAALNLGGIANVTVVAPGADTLAFDTGPANALIDVVARRITGEPRGFDRDGLLAARGTVHAGLLADLLAEPYYGLPAPKSTGKELFHGAYLDGFLARYPDLDPHDVAATVTELTARTVADACRAHGVRSVVASGGGTRNPVLVAALRRELGADVPLTTTDETLGLPEGAKEACLMALVGWLAWHGLPGTLPSVTGAAHPTIAGRLTPGAGPLRLPAPLTTSPTALRVR